MTQFQGKTIWLIGASEGLGRALAKRLDQEGAQLILSARNTGRLDDLHRMLSNSKVVPLDVTKIEAVKWAAKVAGPVDAVVYNAGVYEPMRTTEWDSEAILRMADVNFSGALRVLGQVVPDFVERGHGDVTLIGSLSGYRGLPAAVGYGASKAALISLAETMRLDLKDTGVTVRLVNPGFIKTRLTEKNGFYMPMLMTPEKAAERVLAAMRKRRFRTDFPAPFSWVIRAFNCLPDALVYRGK